MTIRRRRRWWRNPRHPTNSGSRLRRHALERVLERSAPGREDARGNACTSEQFFWDTVGVVGGWGARRLWISAGPPSCGQPCLRAVGCPVWGPCCEGRGRVGTGGRLARKPAEDEADGSIRELPGVSREPLGAFLGGHRGLAATSTLAGVVFGVVRGRLGALWTAAGWSRMFFFRGLLVPSRGPLRQSWDSFWGCIDVPSLRFPDNRFLGP